MQLVKYAFCSVYLDLSVGKVKVVAKISFMRHH